MPGWPRPGSGRWPGRVASWPSWSARRGGGCGIARAGPIRKGKLGKPNEFVWQLAEVTENTKPGARGLILPASTALGNPAEETLVPGTVAELKRRGLKPREVAVDGGFKSGPTSTAFADLQPKTVFVAGRQQPASKRTTRRLRRYRTGEEGRISHLKRRYGLDDPASKATRAEGSGLSGRFSPKTPTPSPSGTVNTPDRSHSTRANPTRRNGRARLPRGRSLSRVIPREVSRQLGRPREPPAAR
jgi:transposase, IS5 family